MSTTQVRPRRQKLVVTHAPTSIRYWRLKRGFTLEGLAQAIGVKNPSITRAELTGRGLGRAKMKELAHVLGVEVWQLHVPLEKAPDFFGKESNEIA